MSIPPSPSPDLSARLSQTLYTTKSLLPTPAWLASFLASQQRAATTPLPALVQTAGWRLLNSDITETIQAVEGGCFPVDVGAVGGEVGERRVGRREGEREGGVVCQVLAVEDMSKSRWEQIEAIEALERGEGTRGREIIRVAPTVADGDGVDATTNGPAVGSSGRAGPHKLLLQDAAGRKCWAIELRSVDGVGVGMSIGCKVLLRETVVTRGHVLLEPGTVTVLGGRIEELERRWREGRKGELRAQLEREGEGEGRGG